MLMEKKARKNRKEKWRALLVGINVDGWDGATVIK